METIHDKLKENSRVHQQRGAVEAQPQNAAVSPGGGEERKAAVPAALRGFLGAPGRRAEGAHLKRSGKKNPTKTYATTPQRCGISYSGTMPKLSLPRANESVMLQIIYSIFNSDYTRRGDLNLITKLGGFKTNPFKSDTVD